MTRRWASHTLLLLALALLLASCFLYWRDGARVESKVDASSLLFLGLTMLVGLVIERSIGRGDELEKAEKDFLCDEIRDLRCAVGDVTTALSRCSSPDAGDDLHRAYVVAMGTLGRLIANVSYFAGECDLKVAQKEALDLQQRWAAIRRHELADDPQSLSLERQASAARALGDLNIGVAHLIITVRREPHRK